MKKLALFCAALLTLCCAESPQAAPEPGAETSQIILSRLGQLYEEHGLADFDQLNDEILDAAAGTFATGTSPARHALYDRAGSPRFFSGPDSVDQFGNPFDTAIAKKDAAGIAAYYFGRPAPLKKVRGNFMYDFMHDGPLLCSSELDKVEKTASGYMISGKLMCTDGPDGPAAPRAVLKVGVTADSQTPLGWVVQSFHAEEAAAGNVYQNKDYGFELSWPDGSFIISESDSGDGITVSDPKLGMELKAWGSRYWDVIGLDFRSGVADTGSWFDNIILKQVREEEGSFIISGISGDNVLYVKGMVLPDGVTAFLSVTYPRSRKDIFDEFTDVAARTFRPLGIFSDAASSVPPQPMLTDRLLMQEAVTAMWHAGIEQEDGPVLLKDALKRPVPPDMFATGTFWLDKSNWVFEGDIRCMGVFSDGIEGIMGRASFRIDLERDADGNWILHHIVIRPMAMG